MKIENCHYDCRLLDVLMNIKYATARHSNESIVDINGTKSFVNGVYLNADATVLGLVNGLKLPADLIMQGSQQVVFGHTVFADHVTIQGNTTASNINGINITNMYNTALRNTGNQIISGIKTVFRSG